MKIIYKHGASSEFLYSEKADKLIKYQPESVIIYAGTADLTNEINMLNKIKKVVIVLTTKLPKVNIWFLGLIIRKDRKNLDKNITAANKRNYCRQKDMDDIDNSIIREDPLEVKKSQSKK